MAGPVGDDDDDDDDDDKKIKTQLKMRKLFYFISFHFISSPSSSPLFPLYRNYYYYCYLISSFFI